MQEAKERIFGFVLMNDWSARDIQKWEYVPLGPFTSKNFATTISPWIVTTEALEAYKVPTSAVQQVNPVPLDYLQDPDYSSYDIQLSVGIQSESMKEPHVVSTSNFANLYWNAAQQLVHHSVTGCIMKAGDLLGSGTISGTTDDSFGSMLELSWKGTKLVQLSGDGTGETRKFLQDGDTVIMKGFCSKPGHGRVGFGECSGKVYPCGSTIDCKARPSATTQQPSRYKDFKLYSLWRSSSSWRVRIALAAKNVSYTTIPISIEQGESQQDWFLQEKNRMGQLPVLEYTDSSTDEIHTLTQSVAIFEFLDCLFPHTKRLFPIDPMDKIGAMELVEIINSGTQPLQNHGTIKFIEETTRNERIVNAFRQDSIRKGLQSIVGKLVKRRRRRRLQQNGPYAMGTFSPTIVDCFLIPQLYNAKRYGVDVDQEFPLLSSIEVACNDHPWFRTTHPSNQPDTPPS
jgi:maleylacetoacetate isomerase